MENKKFRIMLLFVILIILVVIFKGYGNYIKNERVKEAQEKRIESFRNSLRYSYQLDDKEYKYVESESNTFGIANYKNMEVKYNSFSFSSREEYVTTIIDNKIINIYCGIPISQEDKEFIQSKFLGSDNLIDVSITKNKDVAFVSSYINGEMSAYIVDLKSKETMWSKDNKIQTAYYKVDSNSVICSRTNMPGDTIWGQTEFTDYEITLDDMQTLQR